MCIYYSTTVRSPNAVVPRIEPWGVLNTGSRTADALERPLIVPSIESVVRVRWRVGHLTQQSVCACRHAMMPLIEFASCLVRHCSSAPSNCRIPSARDHLL